MMFFEKTLRTSDLDQFTGSEHWYRHWLNPMITYTDGARYVAETGDAYWLLDAIVSHQCQPAVRALDFQVWTLKVADNRTATLSCEDGDHNVAVTQRIEFTDFPLNEIALWFQNEIIFLPSEY
jgi:hypothetical protein